MWRYLKWTFRIVVAAIVFGFFHYVLPQHDIVRVVNTYQERVDLNDWTRVFWSSPDTQAGALTNRDVQFIQTVTPKGKPMVYRNEDTGWIWPPYFKFDTSNLQTEAEDLKSTADVPKWVSVTHYGWRIPFLSIYPNAVGIKPVDGPDVTIIPWVNIIILTLLLLLGVFLWRLWAQFRERAIDPLLEDVEETWDTVDERADEARGRARSGWGRFTGWLGTWKGKPRR